MTLQKRPSKQRSSKGRGASPSFIYRIQIRLPGGKRQTIRLGALSAKAADEIDRHITRLIESARHGTQVDPETIAWTGNADRKLIKKLVALGLCKPVVVVDNAPLVSEFVAAYIDQRKTDWAQNTITNFRQLENQIKNRFSDRLIGSVTRKDAMEFYTWLRTTKGLSENTARRFIGRSREIFLEAVEQGIVADNPFKTRKLKVAVGAADKTYIDEATINEVIEHCPSTEWKLLFAFARFVGCRMPSEIEHLTWEDINWEKGTMLIASPKTKRYGKGERLVPIFPEVADLLSRQFAEAAEGELYVFPRLRNHSCLATTAKKYVKKAGIIPWSEFWNALRASRETDLMDSHGPSDACRWIGNTLAVAARHYQLMRKEPYSGRIQKSDAKSDATPTGNKQKIAEPASPSLKKPNKSSNSLVGSTPNRNRTCD